ncbi:MAG: NYN domain-containing protein [bacterium]
MKLLIDGYNLIPAIPELGRVLRKDLEQGREGLLVLLRDYKRTSSSSPDITVVFDGKRNPGGETATRQHGINVVFSRGEIADDLILRMLQKEMRGATLVTSDRALDQAAREWAGAVVRTGEFADRLLMASEADGEPGGKEQRPRRTSTKKKGNPRRLPKKERNRQRNLGKL